MIYYRNDVRESGIDARAVKAIVMKLLAEVGETTSSISISFVDDAAIRELNREHRGKDTATDVLSFPLDDVISPEKMLGDVVVSVETARRQAGEYDASLADEVSRLLIHGILHLLGHDHMEDAERMRMEAEERRLADAIGMKWPYPV